MARQQSRRPRGQGSDGLTAAHAETIAAVSTAPGAAAVAIVRLSGSEALAIGRRLSGIDPRPRYAELCDFKACDGSHIDQGLLLYFPAPHSYTGEDIVELQVHGGRIVADWVLETVFSLGARAARPGEFTLRAFLNDKLDLAQAEAVADLIESGSRSAASAALRSLSGGFSEAVEQVQTELTRLRVQAEAWLDFPDEEIDRETTDRLGAAADALTTRLETLLREAEQGRALRDGLTLVIAGPPNAGKSSLLNRIAGYDAAIVTAIPGTTRDTLREHLSLGGLPVSIADTAGLRHSSDPVEIEGVRRAQRELERADRVLWVADIRDGLDAALDCATAQIKSDVPFTVLLNKCDLVDEAPATLEHRGHPILRLSALTGSGLDQLVTHLKAVAGVAPDTGGSFSARRRHVTALTRALAHLRAAPPQLGRELELAAEELRAAQNALSELTGQLTSDDLLGEIFSSFCIGK